MKIRAALATLLTGFAVTAAAPAADAAAGLQEFRNRQHPHDVFWGWNTAHGAHAPDFVLDDIGYSICADHAKGWSADQIMQRMMSYVPREGTIQRQRFMDMRNDALTYIC